VRDVISGIGKPVVLVGHSYGGIVITEAAAHNSAVVGLVYVAASRADHGESAFQLSTMFPGSTLADRPVTEAALSEGLPIDAPAWRHVPSWFAFGDQDMNIPVALHRFMAERAGAKASRELAGASHALSVSEPEAVTATILEAIASP
jgi:pimeloyl-ACP methyl ester carboxylesterase